MRTRLTIMAVVLAAATGVVGTVELLVVTLGWLGALGGSRNPSVLGARPALDQVQHPQVGDQILMLPDTSPRGHTQPLLRRRQSGSRRLV